MSTTIVVPPRQWVVTDGQLVISHKALNEAILSYRRQARARLAEEIWTIEDELCRQLSGVIPLRARLTRERGVNVFGREDIERLRGIIEDTRPRAFRLRQRAGTQVCARFSFWTYRPTACGIDELHDNLGCQYDSRKEGEDGRFDKFVTQLSYLRRLRRAYCGMIKYGLEPSIIRAQSEEEAWVDGWFLPGTIDSAANGLVTEISRLLSVRGRDIDQLFMSRWFGHITESDDVDFADMLESDEQAFWDALGVPQIVGWRQLLAIRVGLPDNVEETFDDDVRLAPVIPIRRRVRRPVSTAISIEA